MQKLIQQRAFPEGYIWMFGILFLLVINPAEIGWTICPIELIGIKNCPGEGLGKSVSFLLHGNLAASLQAHVLGIPALALLLYRIISLFYYNRSHTNSTLTQHGTSN